MREKVFAILVALFLLASLAPSFYEISRRDRLPPVREFELVHNFPTDFNFYLSRIRQGIEGGRTVKEQYTSEPHQGSFIHVFYLWLGWLGRWSRVPWERGGDVYHMARVVFGWFLLVMIAEFCKVSFRDSKFVDRNGKIVIENRKEKIVGRKTRISTFGLLAFLLAVTASTWPKLVAYVNNQVVPATTANITSWRFGGYMSWWSVVDSLQRITFIPHLLVGQALIIFLIMALADRDTMKKPGNWFFLGILAFLEGVIFPPGLLFVVVTSGVLFIFEVLYEAIGVNIFAAAKILTPKNFIPRLVPLGLGVPSLLYLSLMTSFYPWKRLVEFDIVKPLPFEYAEYLKAVGPIMPIGLVGLVIALAFRERRMLPSLAWVMAWGLLLFVFKFIPSQSPLRFSEMTPHVPLGVLAAYLFYVVQNRSGFAFFRDAQGSDKRFIIPSRPSLSETSPPQHLMGSGSQFGRSFSALQKANPRGSVRNFFFLVLLVLPVLLVLLNLGVMYSSFLWQRDFVDHKMRAAYPLVPTGSYVMYPLKDFLRAMKYLQDATSRQTAILSETTAGNYLPVYSGNTVYVGHANTVRAEEKEVVVKQFFSGQMKPDEARALLIRENLRWIFFGPQEKEDGGVGNLANVYPFLTERYKNSFVTVYWMP